MSRPQGQVVQVERQRGTTFAIRFVAGGRRRLLTLGTAGEGWTHARAQTELQNVLADVRRGIWTPPTPSVPVAAEDPTFHEFASEWFAGHKDEWRPGTRADYQWHLSSHLLPFFRSHRLSQITIAEVDRYRATKVREGILSASTINKTLTRLSQILEVAVEYGHIPQNPAKGKRRRLKAGKAAPVWLDSADQITALLDAASNLDREKKTRTPRRAILSTLVFAGLRISELAELRWRDVDLAGGRITIRASKTDAGIRRIDLLAVLQDELATHKANRNPDPDARVFPTATGEAMNPSNIRNRVLSPAVERANKNRAKTGLVPLPDGLTPHKLRHTYTSLLAALGVDPGAMMDQLGHTDPGFTLRVYRHSMRRDTEARRQLHKLVGEPASNGVSGTISGTNPEKEPVSTASEGPA